ncbi:hypothetical protein HAX54_040431 [Datura stramonium]|uniref:Uncharacterized protein n=1 Tax=Datura stramonium TaxID=4076 RepID=A0ABS8VNW2_DATST|nr:hypothetical protein [Datura stramonium]
MEVRPWSVWLLLLLPSPAVNGERSVRVWVSGVRRRGGNGGPAFGWREKGCRERAALVACGRRKWGRESGAREEEERDPAALRRCRCLRRREGGEATGGYGGFGCCWWCGRPERRKREEGGAAAFGLGREGK